MLAAPGAGADATPACHYVLVPVGWQYAF